MSGAKERQTAVTICCQITLLAKLQITYMNFDNESRTNSYILTRITLSNAVQFVHEGY